MTRRALAACFAMSCSVLAGCATARPPQELVDARAAYARAYVGPAAAANVLGLHDARRALDEAEQKFDEDPRSEEARHLAYIAHRRILVAEANARAEIAASQRAQAEDAVARANLNRHDDRADQLDRAKARTGPTP